MFGGGGDHMLTRARTHTRRKQSKLEADQADSAQTSQKLALEAENVRQESRQEDSKVGVMMDMEMGSVKYLWWQTGDDDDLVPSTTFFVGGFFLVCCLHRG